MHVSMGLKWPAEANKRAILDLRVDSDFPTNPFCGINKPRSGGPEKIFFFFGPKLGLQHICY